MPRLLMSPSGRSSRRSSSGAPACISCILQCSNAQMLLSRAVHQESSCPQQPALPMRIAPGHPASRTPTPTPTAVTV